MLSLGLRPGESMRFTVRGDCMASLDDGGSARVRRQRLYLPGDVIVVRRRDHWDAHRFLGYAPSRHGIVALTQADNTSERDPVALASAIVGRTGCSVSVADRLLSLRNYAGALLRRLAEAGR